MPSAPLEECGNKYDIVLIENKTNEITFKATDPDDDEVYFNITGWRADYYENLTSVQNIGDCHFVNSEKIYLSESDERWHLDKYSGFAYLFVNHTDIEFHNFTVYALSEDYDDMSKEEFLERQIVRVLVDDLPEVKSNASGICPGMEDKFSIEDPFILKAETTDMFNKGSYKYVWIMPKDNKIETTETKLLIPNNYDIISIKNQLSDFGVGLGEKEFKVRVYQGDNLLAEKSVNITFKQCIPYSGSGEMYPFGITFCSPHKCCDANGNYFGNNKVCYTSTTFGSFNSFNETKYKQYDSSITALFSKPAETNAIYNRTFTRMCSGDRGNICSGQATDIITVKYDCGSTNQCKGPSRELLKPNSETTDLSKAVCTNYSAGETFNALKADPFATNLNEFCLANQKATGEGTNTLSTTGNYSCDVQCLNGQCGKAVNCKCAYGDPECNGISWFSSGAVESDTCDATKHRKIKCNNQCQPITTGTDNEKYGSCCRMSGTNTACNDLLPGQTPQGYANSVCNASCELRNCGLFKIDNSPDGCSETECASLPGKMIGFDATNNECVECNNDKTKGNTGKCEEVCGASEFCDELATNTLQGICSDCNDDGKGLTCIKSTASGQKTVKIAFLGTYSNCFNCDAISLKDGNLKIALKDKFITDRDNNTYSGVCALGDFLFLNRGPYHIYNLNPQNSCDNDNINPSANQETCVFDVIII